MPSCHDGSRDPHVREAAETAAKGASGDGTRTTTVERTARQEAQFSRKQGFARIDLERQRNSWSRAALRRVTRWPPPPLPSSFLLPFPALLPSLCPASDHKGQQAVSGSQIDAMVVDVQKSLQPSASQIREEYDFARERPHHRRSLGNPLSLCLLDFPQQAVCVEVVGMKRAPNAKASDFRGQKTGDVWQERVQQRSGLLLQSLRRGWVRPPRKKESWPTPRTSAGGWRIRLSPGPVSQWSREPPPRTCVVRAAAHNTPACQYLLQAT